MDDENAVGVLSSVLIANSISTFLQQLTEFVFAPLSRQIDVFGVYEMKIKCNNRLSSNFQVLTEYDGFDLFSADTTKEIKIVSTKFVSRFCHRQLTFCLLVRIGPMFNFFSKCIKLCGFDDCRWREV